MQSDNRVPAEAYTREYYETCCDGYVEFQRSGGAILPKRLAIPLELAELKHDMAVLDVGCGRGEILFQAVQQGARAFGFDYSLHAVAISVEALKSNSDAMNVLVHLANAQRLPYADSSFDRVFMLDVVEHLYPQELHRALVEIRRVLRADGRLIIHTMPNTWYYRWGYPVFRLTQRMRGKRLPAAARDRWSYADVHVNEQNPVSMRHALQAAGFRAKVWLRSTQSYSEESSRIMRAGMRALATIYPFRWIFCNDLFAVATK